MQNYKVIERLRDSVKNGGRDLRNEDGTSTEKEGFSEWGVGRNCWTPIRYRLGRKDTKVKILWSSHLWCNWKHKVITEEKNCTRNKREKKLLKYKMKDFS